VGFGDRSLDLCLPCPYIIVYTSITRPGWGRQAGARVYGRKQESKINN
jgi:hypothetical protein